MHRAGARAVRQEPIAGDAERCPAVVRIGRDVFDDWKRVARRLQRSGIKRLGEQRAVADKEQVARRVCDLRIGSDELHPVARVQRPHVPDGGRSRNVQKVPAVGQKSRREVGCFFQTDVELGQQDGRAAGG